MCDTTAFISYWNGNIDNTSNGVDGFCGKHFSRSSYHSWMMQGNAKTSLLNCLSGMNAQVVPWCTLHAFPKLHSYSPITFTSEKRRCRRRPHWDGFEWKTRFLRNRIIPVWGWGENKMTPMYYIPLAAPQATWDSYTLRSSETWSLSHVAWPSGLPTSGHAFLPERRIWRKQWWPSLL